MTHVDHGYDYDAVNNTGISCAANGEGHRGAKPPPENQIFLFKKKPRKFNLLYINYANLVVSVGIGICTNSSRELFARIIRVSVKQA